MGPKKNNLNRDIEFWWSAEVSHLLHITYRSLFLTRSAHASEKTVGHCQMKPKHTCENADLCNHPP